MNIIICPKCGAENDAGTINCEQCRVNLQWALEHPSEFERIKRQIQGLPSRLSAYRLQYEENLIRAAKNFKGAIAQIDKKYISDMRGAKQDYNLELTAIHKRLREISAILGPTALDWSDQTWDNNYYGKNIPVGVRLGTALFRGHFDDIEHPALVPILNQGNLIFMSRGSAKKTAIQALQSSLLRAVATFPPGKIKLTLMDPIGLGANVAGFMNLPEQIIGNKAWTEPRDIEQQLADISVHMENVIQKYLRNEYKTMEEYNRRAGEIAEPYRFLAVINFPANFTDTSAKRLISIASNGPRAGVYVICTIDGESPLPYGFNLSDLLRTGSVIEANENGEFVWKVPELEKLSLRLDKPPAPERFNKIILPISDIARAGDRVEVPFEKISLPESTWWKGNTSLELKVPLGRKGAREIQYLEFGQGTQHYGLMAGKPGSGKSTLLHVLIANLALTYPPEELVLYLVDFKKGVEFKDYAVFKLPHARVIGIESEREFGLGVLKEVEQEMNRRGDLFRQANFQDFFTYRTKTNNRLPRIFLIVDEFQRLFSEDDPLADQAANILAHIVQQGRAFGIHVILASQTLADAYAVGRATYDKMSVRIALQCTEADSRLILGEDNSAARLLSRPGEAVYNALNGREEGNNFFQVVWLPDDKREYYLKQIAALAEKNRYRSPFQQVVFEGHIPSKISSNTELWSVINSNQMSDEKSAIRIFMGESTEINPPHTETFIRPQGRSNIMILGQNERTAFSLISTIWLSICAYAKLENTQFYVVDFSRADDSWATILPNLQKTLPHSTTAARSRDFEKLLCQVDKDLDERLKNGDNTGKRIFFILAGLHRARELRVTDQYGSPGEASQTFGKICREGPDLGIHVIAWCDNLGNLNRLVDRKTLAEFDLRIAMQMGEDDSNQFIETPKAKSLGQNRAYLYDLDQIGKLEKFRPYELISAAELDEIQMGFAKRNKSKEEDN